jgi:hypothetical protein
MQKIATVEICRHQTKQFKSPPRARGFSAFSAAVLRKLRDSRFVAAEPSTNLRRGDHGELLRRMQNNFPFIP